MIAKGGAMNDLANAMDCLYHDYIGYYLYN